MLLKRFFSTGVPMWWKKPVYYNPVVSPLDRGPDFSFLDGRKPQITTKWQLERRLKQVELGKNIVKYLAELREAEEIYHEHRLQRTLGNERIEQNTPTEKGKEEIF